VPLRLIAQSNLQCGVVTRAQVAGAGLSDDVVGRLVANQTWRVVTRGVYALQPDSFDQRAWAGVLIGGARAVVGEAAAAFLHGIVSVAPERITVLVGRDTPARRQDARWQFVRRDARGGGEPPRTGVAQTIIDLAGRLGPDELAPIVSRAINLRLAEAADITELLGGQPRARGRRTLLALLGASP
jgi:hypothetical protein